MKTVRCGLVIAVLILSSCQEQIQPIATFQPTNENQDEISPKFLYGEVDSIESVHAIYPTERSGNIQIVVTGTLADGCTEIDKVSSVLNGNTFTIRIFTKKDSFVLCTAVRFFQINCCKERHGKN